MRISDWSSDVCSSDLRSHAPANPGQDRALAPDPEKPHPAGELLTARRPRSPDRGLRRTLQSQALSRETKSRDARRPLLLQGPGHHQTTRQDKAPDHRKPALAAPQARRLPSHPRQSKHHTPPPHPSTLNLLPPTTNEPS